MTQAADQLGRSWHQALAYAVTGRRWPELGHQESPDLPLLTAWLRSQLPDGRAGTAHVVPADLLVGIGPAQFWAVLSRLRAELGPAAGPRPAPVLADRPLTADERRLLVDVPPHHGS